MIITMLKRFVLPRSDRYHAHAATGGSSRAGAREKGHKMERTPRKKIKHCCRKMKVTASVETGTEK